MSELDPYRWRRYSTDLRSQWDHVARQSHETWMFHDMDLCEVYAKRLGALNESIILFDRDERPVALCPLFFMSSRSYGLPYRRLESFDVGGPAVIDEFSDKKRRELFQLFGA